MILQNNRFCFSCLRIVMIQIKIMEMENRTNNNNIISSMKDYKTGYLSEQQHYQQLSELMRKSYESTSDISLYVQIDQITQWVDSQNSKPLLITSDEFGGKKTLICQFIKNIEKSKSNCLVISEFASVTPYYSEILYKTTMQLRTHLNINQKVELNEQKLRQYFRYWLEVADDKIQKDYLGYSKQEKKIGIDKVVDNKHQTVRPSFWLPDLNLKNIKIILTAQMGSSLIQSIIPTISQRIQYVISDSKITAIKQKLCDQNPKLKKFSQSIHFGDLKIINKILKSHQKMQISENQINFEQFLLKFIKYCTTFIDTQQNIYKLLACLIWSKKGLVKNTIRRSYKFANTTVDKFLVAFKDIIIVSNDETYLIINRRMRQCINKLISSKFAKLQLNFRKHTHLLISKALKRQNNTINALEEMIYHLINSHNYTELKQLLSRIQNFLVLYTPLTKHLLCVCWFQLQVQFQYDPVFQYNKAIQRFLNHYYPSPEDTFKIIFQLSLFFKQYSQFQNSKISQFRHPPIRGQIDHLKQISIYDELIQMNMYQKCKIKNKEILSQSLNMTKKQNPKESQKQKSLIKQTSKNQDSINQEILNGVEVSEGKQVESLNVRIKFHQDKFKSLYLEEMQSYVNTFYVLKKKNLTSQRNQLLDEDSDDSQNQLDESKIDLQKIKKGLVLKKFSDYCEQEYHRCSQNRSFYYYKQWIWMQFPWICQSLNNNYSQLIERCMKSPTEYMSIELESKLIREAVKIAKIAKQNKKQIYQLQNTDKKTKLALQIKANTMRQYSQSQSQRSKIKQKTAKMQSKDVFDVSKIDEQLQKNKKQKKKTYKYNQSNIFMTDISMTQSHVEQKQNSNNGNLTSKFPNILKGSRLAVSKAEKNIDISDTRQYSMLVTKYDQLKYQNEQLVSKIQSIQQNRSSLKENNKQYEKQLTKLTIEQLKSRKQKLAKQYKTQQALKAKLQMIIKLCDINKSHGSESADLNNFLNSLKIMFKIQEKNLQNINQNGRKVLEQRKNQYKKLKQQKANIQIKAKKQKNKFQRTMSKSILGMSENFKQLNKTKHHNKKRKKSLHKTDSVKKQKLDKQLENLNSLIRNLNEQFGIDFDSSQKNERILEQFEQKVDKLNQIQWKLNQLIDQNFIKQRRINQLEQRLNVNRGHREHQKQLAHRSMQSLANQNLHKAQQRIKCLQRCFSLIQQQKTPLQTSRDY